MNAGAERRRARAAPRDTFRPTSQRIKAAARVAIPLLVLAAVVRGAMFLFIDMRPANRVHLAGSSWTIVELNGEPMEAGMLSLRFASNKSAGAISSGCFEVAFWYDLDSDDIGLEFYDLAVRGSDCGRTPEAVRTALGQVEGWIAPADNRIEFFDEGGPRLLVATR